MNTNANEAKGIGKQLTADLLLRPATTVIATVRKLTDATSQSLLSLPAADSSNLVVLPLDEADPSIESGSLASRLAAASEQGQHSHSISHIDVVIANAGASAGYDSVLDTNPDAARSCFEVNAIGPLKLFQACWPLLSKSARHDVQRRKFILVTSSVGSIAALEMESFPAAAYGMSKVAANWLAKKISIEFQDEGLKVGIIHPGWVKTGMGQSLADAVGVKEPPMSVGDSAKQVLDQIDKLSLDTTHGKFISFNGQVLPW
ncbi:NAD(P)-binding Rossmann-fold containing protein [Purpureocillium lavendulum]|uniref:NAD(P)-binding Rossmann-fold containing protein n=1 Tax=Purpureocillium lavendulum TaxID=1247861 RepID=A0AB34FLN8_9HYPO|nr:NAD(P)-binding Rossmann-fold containing protein [Purpureocillium lavendulum]